MILGRFPEDTRKIPGRFPETNVSKVSAVNTAPSPGSSRKLSGRMPACDYIFFINEKESSGVN